MEKTSSDNPPDNLPQVLEVIEQSDLLFLLGDIATPNVLEMVLTLGEKAQAVDCHAVGIFPDTGNSKNKREWPRTVGQVLDCCFTTSARAMTDHKDILASENSRSSIDHYAMRQIVAMMTDLIQLDSPICIDYVDVVEFIKTGFSGKMAVDIATDDEKGVNVALLALERLRAQGVDL